MSANVASFAPSFVAAARPTIDASHTPQASSAAASAPALHVWAIAAMLFLLAGANGRPFWWSSAFPAAFIALCVIGARGPRHIAKHALSKTNAPILWCLLLLTATGAVSTLTFMDIDIAQTFVLRCLLPFLIYFSVVGIRLRASDIGFCMLAIVLGSSIPLGWGLHVFYRNNGIPDLRDLLYARYDADRMREYMDVTFGNVGHVGMYALLVAPGVFVAIYSRVFSRLTMWLCGVWMCVVAVNIVVSGSRTACAVGLAVGAVLVFALHKRHYVTLIAVTLLGASMFLASADLVDESLLIERLYPSLGSKGRDTSVEDRVESIEIGWNTFVANTAFGVGPGMSGAYNPHGVAHQSLLMVASETGILGGFSFFLLNVVVLFRTAVHTRRARRSSLDRKRLLWIVGPASWLTGGLVAGLTFNMDLALLWVGTAYAMLGLYGFDDGERQVPLSIPVGGRTR